jgi:hypothetical protein
MIKIFEKYNDLSLIKMEVFIKAVQTYDLEIIKFFIDRDYDFNNEKVFIEASYDDDILRFFLEKGIDFEKFKDDYDFKGRLKDVSVQSIFLDFGYELFIYETLGSFNDSLRQNPKYNEIIERFEDAKNYNL